MALTAQHTAIATLYTALFNRAPDADGFAFWVQAHSNGASLAALAESMITSPEAMALYPVGQTNDQFITAYYTSVFGRAPDAGGLAFWSAALAAQGGAGNAAAKASLIQQIGAIAATPLTAKPDGMSDADYAQTVADRARFINKAEFGVYFATELKSNDLALARSALALVTDNAISIDAAKKLALGIVDPVSPGPIPSITILSDDSPATILSKFAAYAGNAATVDATGMQADQLSAVAQHIDKVATGGISGAVVYTNLHTAAELTALLSKSDPGLGVAVSGFGMDTAQLAAVGAGLRGSQSLTSVQALQLSDPLITDAVATNLLSRLSGSTSTVVATGATTAELAVLAQRIGRIANDGITGTLDLTSTQSVAQLQALTGAKVSAAATINVDASGMSALQLDAVGVGAAKVDTLTNLPQLVLADLSDTATAALIDKSASASVTVNATNASVTALTALGDRIGKIAAGGIASLSLALADIDDTTTAGLLSKAVDARVVATGGSATETASLVANLSNIAAGGVTGALAITKAVGNTDLAALLAKYTGNAVTADVTGMSQAQFVALYAANGKIAANGITGTLDLGVGGITGMLLPKGANLNVVVTGADGSQLSALASNIARVATGGILGDLAIPNGFSPTSMDSLLGKYAGSTATVNALGMGPTQWVTVAGAVTAGKIADGGITSLSFALAPSDDATTTALLSKASGAMVAAGGGTSVETRALVTHLANIAANGITGDLLVDSGITGADITSLLAKYAGNTAKIDLQGMGTAMLDAVVADIAKVGAAGVAGTLNLNLGSDGVATAVMAKTTGISVATTSASTAKMDEVIANIGKVVDAGLSGVVSLTKAQLDTLTVTTLNAKVMTGSSIALAGTADKDVIDVSAVLQPVTVTGGAGADVITLGKATDRIVIGSTADSRAASFLETDTTTANIDTIHGFPAGGRIFLSHGVDGAYGDFALVSGATAGMSRVMTPVELTVGQSFADLYAALAARSASGYTASSETHASSLLVTVTGTSDLTGAYVIVNDHDRAVTAADLIVSLVGYSSGSLPFLTVM